MIDLPPIVKYLLAILSGVISLLLGALLYIWGLLVKKVNRQGTRLAALESSRVTWDEFRRHVDSSLIECRQMHQDNKDSLERIHDRLDQVWEKLSE